MIYYVIAAMLCSVVMIAGVALLGAGLVLTLNRRARDIFEEAIDDEAKP